MQNRFNIEDIKANYHDLIVLQNKEVALKIVNDNQKEQYAQVFIELLDTSKKIVKCITKEETDIIRKYIGVGGKAYSKKELAQLFNVCPNSIEVRVRNIATKLRYRMLRGFVDLEQAYLNKMISEEEILSLPVDILYELSPRLRHALARMHIQSINDVILYRIRDFKTMYSIGDKTLNQLTSFIHKFGLYFKDEEPVIENEEEVKECNNYVEFEKYINQADLYVTSPKNKEDLVELKLLVSKLKALDEEEKTYDEKIKRLVNKKEEIQKTKEELLTNMLEKTYQKKIGER